ncbi:hypothetical protein GWK47_054677 [Chionoecetes opilio]|uniref:Uncharacterized protein n=1 Tax=Chionoecetes opilio TaxID=41210 RepID=A0A8J5CNX7_CHIOP|nr:hypothetical protein GWK47_054677 [Chionoecetes opilio]
MFHILETRPTKVRWCLLARERGTSTASPLVSTVLVLRVAILGGCRNPARCGTPCTCALWNTTSAATSLRCSSESRGLTGSNWAGGSEGSAASTSRRARRWMLSSLLVCEAAHDIQERAAYSNRLITTKLSLPALRSPMTRIKTHIKPNLLLKKINITMCVCTVYMLSKSFLPAQRGHGRRALAGVWFSIPAPMA